MAPVFWISWSFRYLDPESMQKNCPKYPTLDEHANFLHTLRVQVWTSHAQLCWPLLERHVQDQARQLLRKQVNRPTLLIALKSFGQCWLGKFAGGDVESFRSQQTQLLTFLSPVARIHVRAKQTQFPEGYNPYLN